MVGPPIPASPCTFALTMEDGRPIAIGVAVTVTGPVGTFDQRRVPVESVVFERTKFAVLTIVSPSALLTFTVTSGAWLPRQSNTTTFKALRFGSSETFSAAMIA